MNLDELSRIDLRLLVAFNALAEEKSVTRAAERLQLSQPALSRQLRQLRTLFGDALFTRHSHGLTPTPRAQAIQRQLQPLLDDILRLVAPVAFQPLTLERTFRLAGIDPLTQRLSVPLLNQLRDEAPWASLRIVNLDSHSMDALVGGQLDFILTLGDDAVPANIHARTLSQDRAIAMVGRHHPLAGTSSISPEQWALLRHADFWIPGFSDRAIPDWIINQRQIVLETNNMETALNAICQSDLVMIGGAEITRHSPRWQEVVAIPFQSAQPLPKVPIRLLWHSRYHEDAAHQWLREQISQIYQQAPAGDR